MFLQTLRVHRSVRVVAALAALVVFVIPTAAGGAVLPSPPPLPEGGSAPVPSDEVAGDPESTGRPTVLLIGDEHLGQVESALISSLGTDHELEFVVRPGATLADLAAIATERGGSIHPTR